MNYGCLCGHGESCHFCSPYHTMRQHTPRGVAIQRLARVLRVSIDWRQDDEEVLKQLAAAAEELLADAIIRERL